jgi:hypothetical protein
VFTGDKWEVIGYEMVMFIWLLNICQWWGWYQICLKVNSVLMMYMVISMVLNDDTIYNLYDLVRWVINDLLMVMFNMVTTCFYELPSGYLT